MKMRRARWGGGRLYRRGLVWWLAWSLGGVKHRESSGSTDRQVAAELLARRLHERRPGAGGTTLADLRAGLEADYRAHQRRSWERAAIAWAHVESYFGATEPADAITRQRLASYLAHRLDAGTAPSTAGYELSLLRRALRLLDLPAVRFPTVAGGNRRLVFIRPEEHEAIVAELRRRGHGDLADAVVFASRTGWRARSDILTLRWAAVDQAAKTIRLPTAKTTEVVVLPFAGDPVLVELIARRRHLTDEVQRVRGVVVPWVFHHRGGKAIKDHYAAWRAACLAVGLPGRRLHDYRRSVARELVMAGVPDLVAMRLVGWRTRQMLDRYTIVREQDLAQAVASRARTKRQGRAK